MFSQISIKKHRLMKYVKIEIDPKRTVMRLNAPEYQERCKGFGSGKPNCLVSNARCKSVFLKTPPSLMRPWHPTFTCRNL